MGKKFFLSFAIIIFKMIEKTKIVKSYSYDSNRRNVI